MIKNLSKFNSIMTCETIKYNNDLFYEIALKLTKEAGEVKYSKYNMSF